MGDWWTWERFLLYEREEKTLCLPFGGELFCPILSRL